MSSVAWSRPEAFGAWVRLDDATLLAVDAPLAARLGVEAGGPEHDASTRALELHLAVTARCPVSCAGCYLDATKEGEHPETRTLLERIDAIAAGGASTLAFGGGEPLLRDDLGLLASHARALGLVPVLTTSGFGLSEAKLEGLRGFSQINVSHDGMAGAYEEVRGFSGAATAERAISLLVREGFRVGVNLVLTQRSLTHLVATATDLHARGVIELQLLRFKPAGRARGLGYLGQRLRASDLRALGDSLDSILEMRGMGLRIDCALVPLLSDWLLGQGIGSEQLGALGVWGCEAGRHLGSRTVRGFEAPCSFLGTEERPPASSELRSYHAALPAPCGSCALRDVCRGGCQVVTRALEGAFGPDPECPQVLRSSLRSSESPRETADHPRARPPLSSERDGGAE